MSVPQIYLNAQPSFISRSTFYTLRKLGRKWSHLPALQTFRPLARRLVYSAEPAGRVLMQDRPVVAGHKDCKPLIVLSANLWHDWPRQRRLSARLEAFARLVESKEADIILLQEISRTPDFRANEWLSQRLGMAYVYSRANGHEETGGFEEGLAVFSRYPLGEPYLKELGNRSVPFVRRLALGVCVDTPCGNLLAFSVHLGLMPGENTRQLARLRSWVGEIAGERTALIGGDFNAHESLPQIVETQSSWIDTFRQIDNRADASTYRLHLPNGKVWFRKRFDYIFIKPGETDWRVLETRHMETDGVAHSDHMAVLTRLAPAI